jgi:polyamine oxidase
MSPPLHRREFLRGALALSLFMGLPATASARGKRRIPALLGTCSSRWGKDPFALGAYSYPGGGSLPGDRSSLAAPIGGRLFFAGEATSSDYPCTVHGAWLSGVRAAEQVVESGARSAVVIGAGMSGLAAAHTLLAAGVAVEVVEARQRAGGRMITDNSLGYPADLGASWIHGPRGNPVMKLARGFDLPTRRFDGGRMVVGQPDGSTSGLAGLMNPLKLLRAIHRMDLAGERLGPDGTLQQAIDEAVAALRTDPKEEHIIRQLAYHGYASGSAADPDRLSWHGLDEGTGFAGLDRIIVPGYSALIERLADDLPIRFSQVVRRIETRSGGARVTTAGRAFSAEAVVVTLPLGVLKSGSIDFDPGLPAPKQAAMGRLGMGQVHKLALLFDEVFWDDADTIVFLRPEIGRSPVFFNLHRTTGLPALVMWHVGRAATAMEARAEAQVAEDALDALEAMYGHA